MLPLFSAYVHHPKRCRFNCSKHSFNNRTTVSVPYPFLHLFFSPIASPMSAVVNLFPQLLKEIEHQPMSSLLDFSSMPNLLAVASSPFKFFSSSFQILKQALPLRSNGLAEPVQAASYPHHSATCESTSSRHVQAPEDGPAFPSTNSRRRVRCSSLIVKTIGELSVRQRLKIPTCWRVSGSDFDSICLRGFIQ